jgi:hypothetical protein
MISLVCPTIFIVGTKKLTRILKSRTGEWFVQIFANAVQYYRTIFKKNEVGISPAEQQDVENY